MSAPKQWDISKAVLIASFFNFFHSVGNFCIFPFLTIFFRHLGLSPPLVGIVMGAKHIVSALWTPFCSLVAKTTIKRRIAIVSSLIMSMLAAEVLTIYPVVLTEDLELRFCNASFPGINRLTTPSAMDFEMFASDDNSTLTLPEPPLTTTSASTPFTSFRTKTLIKNLETTRPQESFRNMDTTTSPLVNPTRSDTSITLQKWSTDRPAKLKDGATTSGLSIWKPRTSSADTNERTSLTEMPLVDPNSSGIHLPPQNESSSHFVPKKRGLGKMSPLGTYFLDAEIKIFFFILGIVLFWELFVSPLEWIADNGLYEYLDFVDATDRHERVWIWRYLGACLGSTFIVILIDNLNCLVIPHVPKFYLHFFVYIGFIFVTLLLSIPYPIYVSKKTEHASKTGKALGLMGSDGRIVLLSITLFLMGAVRSTTENFLFWQMQDIGSSELYMGFSVTLALVSEMVLYMCKNKLVKSLSFKWMVGLALLCQAAQFLYYSFLWAPWAVLPIQPLSAFSNGVLLWAVKSQVDDVATPGTERSIQLILHCLSHHCGASLGSFASGFVIARFGLPILYWACCVALLIWLSMFLIIQPKLPQVKKINYSRLLAPDNSDMSDSEDEQERDWLVKAMKDDHKVW